MIVIRELAEIVAIHELDTEVLAASIRNPLHMTQAALAGAHVATLPFKILQQMVHHPLTDKGIVQFKKDWEGAPRGGGRQGLKSAPRACASPRALVRVRAIPAVASPLRVRPGASAAAHHAPDPQLVVELDEVGPQADGEPAAVGAARASPSGFALAAATAAGSATPAAGRGSGPPCRAR